MADTSATLLLRTEPIGKLLLRYSLPAIAAMVVFSLYNIIDSIFIGHGVGPLAISGLAITFPVMNLTFALVLLVGIGGASICSIRLGQQDIDGCYPRARQRPAARPHQRGDVRPAVATGA